MYKEEIRKYLNLGDIDNLYDYLMSEDFDKFYKTRDIFPMHTRDIIPKVTLEEDINQIQKLEKQIENHKKNWITIRKLAKYLSKFGLVSGPALLNDLDTMPKNCSLTISCQPKRLFIDGYRKIHSEKNTDYYVDNSIYQLPDVDRYIESVVRKYGDKETVRNYMAKIFGVDNYIILNFVGDCKDIFPGVYFPEKMEIPKDKLITYRSESLLEYDEEMNLVRSEILMENMLYAFEYGFQIKGIDRSELLREYYEQKLIVKNKKAQTICNFLDHYELFEEKAMFEKIVSVKYFDIANYYAFKRKPEGEMKKILKKLSPALKSHKAAVSGSCLLPMLGAKFEPNDIDVYIPIDMRRIERDIERTPSQCFDGDYGECYDMEIDEDNFIALRNKIEEVQESIMKNFMRRFKNVDEIIPAYCDISSFRVDGKYKIQLIFISSIYTIQDIIEEFDFDFLKFYYDGRFVRGSINAYDSLVGRFSVYRPNISNVVKNYPSWEEVKNFVEDDIIFGNSSDQSGNSLALSLDSKAQDRLSKYRQRGFSFSFMDRSVTKNQIYINPLKYPIEIGEGYSISRLFGKNYFEKYLAQ